MKTLFLMRHAKAEPADFEKSDFERNLLPKGCENAVQIADYLKNNDCIIDHVLSSSANRAFQTAQIVAESFGLGLESIDQEEDLYMSGCDAYLSRLAQISTNKDNVIVVGHNPTIAHLTSVLINDDIDFPTAAVAVLEINITSWKDISLETQRAVLKMYISPKSI